MLLPKTRGLKLVGLIFLLGVLPVMALMFSVTGLDRHKELRDQMTMRKDSFFIPDFQVVSPNKDTVSKNIVKGSIWVAHFVDGACDEDCKASLKAISEIQANFIEKKDGAKIIIGTHTVNDTANTVQREAATVGIDSLNWATFPVERNEFDALKENYKLGNENINSTLALVDSKGLLCEHYPTQMDTVKQMIGHMIIILPKKSTRKHLVFRREKDIYTN